MVDQVKAIERTITEMEAADQVHETRRAARLQKAQNARVDVNPDMPEQYVDILRAAKLREAETEIKQWDADHGEAIVALREQAQAALDEVRQALADRHYEIHQPSFTPAQWQEAEARRVFVTEDVVDVGLGDLVELRRQATANGDTVGAYLIARAGIRRLDAVLDDDQAAVMEKAEAGQVRDRLYSAQWGDRWQAWQKDAAQLAALDRELARPRGRAERLAQGAYLGDHLGVRLSPERLVAEGVV